MIRRLKHQQYRQHVKVRQQLEKIRRQISTSKSERNSIRSEFIFRFYYF